jgi:virginiamycin B lyase
MNGANASPTRSASAIARSLKIGRSHQVMFFRNLAALLLLTTIAFAADKVSVTIKEWDTPSPNTHPHDTEIGPDGSLWYTGQYANVIGRLDINTGKIQEYKIKTPDSGPHGLVADKEGNIWFTANNKAYIGKLNPKTGEIVEYPMPDPAARDPHTPLFDPNGILWFTVQQGNFVGKLDPKTGKVTLKQSPTPRSNPYGLRMDSKGTPWYCEFGSNKIARIDPQTMDIKEYILPEGARPRRFTIAANDIIYYSDHQRGYLGRLDPKTGKVEEWPSPGGPTSRPYAITALPDGTIWYSESNVTPNTMVRFDPKDNSFMTWPIPSGGGVLRHFVANKEGNKIYIASSGVNKVGVVEISRK